MGRVYSLVITVCIQTPHESRYSRWQRLHTVFAVSMVSHVLAGGLIRGSFVAVFAVVRKHPTLHFTALTIANGPFDLTCRRRGGTTTGAHRVFEQDMTLTTATTLGGV